MNATQNDNEQPALPYNFFHRTLWQARIDSIDDEVDSTFALLRTVVVTVGGLTVEKFMKLVQEGGGKNAEKLIEQVKNKDEGDTDNRLADALDTLSNNGEALDTMSWYLYGLLSYLLRDGLLSLETKNTHRSTYAYFELNQLLNLYLLISKLNNAFWGPIKRLIEHSLTGHETANTLPPLNLYRGCLQHAGADAEILKKAILQRQWRIDRFSDGYARTPQSRALLVTDKLALQAIAPMQPWLLDKDHIKPITYFSQSTHIHALPYSKRYVMVGLSYDLIPPAINKRTYGDQPTETKQDPLPAFELMAIPHEVGHYIYHYATLNNGKTFAELSESFKHNANYRWCEELFSDLYGCLIGGPLAALGLQAMLAASDRDRMLADDEEHPTPILRPFILSEMLRVLSEKKSDPYQFSTVAASLDKNWIAILRRIDSVVDVVEGPPRRIVILDESDRYWEKRINVDAAVKAVRPIIETFATHLLDHTTVSPDIPWSRSNHSSLTDYNSEMAQLTNSDFAFKDVPNYKVSDAGENLWRSAEMTPDENLREFLANWGDSGPLGSGRH